MEVRTLDYHTAGEPLRIVTGGLPPIVGANMLEKRQFMAANLDHYRRLLMLEPRGHADMYGAVVTEPVSEDADCGVLFLHNEGYSTMCGHGIIALATAAHEQGVFSYSDPRQIRIDTPAGLVVARIDSGSGLAPRVSFENVPAFVSHDSIRVEAGGVEVNATIAYGGAFYAYVNAAELDLELVPGQAARLVELGRALKSIVIDHTSIRHPGGSADLGFLYGVIFVAPGEQPGRSRNVCIFADGELDRSPTGTGVSGRAAIHYARGEIGLGDELQVESILGTVFTVSCVRETQVGETAAVITEISGSAYMTGESNFLLAPDDPLADGFLIR